MPVLDIERFFILDCNHVVVGNPNGYRTCAAALRQQDMKGSKAYNAIWLAYEARKADYVAKGVPEAERRNNVSSIKLLEVSA